MEQDLRDEVTKALTAVIDPETGLSVMRMDLIHDLEVDNGAARLVFRPSSPVCPMAYALASNIKKKVQAVPGVTAVDITVQNFEDAERLEALLKSCNR